MLKINLNNIENHYDSISNLPPEEAVEKESYIMLLLFELLIKPYDSVTKKTIVITLNRLRVLDSVSTHYLIERYNLREV